MAQVHPGYQVLIDWSDDGFLETADDVTDRVLDTQALICEHGMDQSRPLQTIHAGKANGELDNRSRDYSSRNASSPLNGKLTAGHQLKIRCFANGADGVGAAGTFKAVDAPVAVNAGNAPVDGYSGPIYDRHLGILDGLPQHPELGRRNVEIPTLGTLSLLKLMSDLELGDPTTQKGISTALYQSITTDVALGHLLDAISFPAGLRILNPGSTVLDWWWLDDEDPLTAAQTLLNSEGPGARLYEDGSGNLVFEGRNYRQTTIRCTTIQATFSDATGSEPRYEQDGFVFDGDEKDVVNQCTVAQKTRSAKALGVVWTYGQTLTLSAGVSQDILATSSDPFTGALTPVVATDYTVSAGSVASLTLNRTSGANVTITVVAGAGGVTLTGLQMRAQAVTTNSSTSLHNSVNAAASQKRYGVKPYPLTVRAEIAANVLQTLCDAIVSWQQNGRAKTTVLVEATGNSARFAAAMPRLISDRITLKEIWTGLNEAMMVEKIADAISVAGANTTHQIAFSLEEAGTAYGLWGTALWDTDLWGF